MFPIALDLTRIAVLVVGQGKLLDRRLAQLEEARAMQVVVVEGRGPTDEEINHSAIVMVCGLPAEEAEKIVLQARTAGKLINVEDVIPLCDFYFTANVRRGDLLIAVSTGGASPTLARRVRDFIGNIFGDEWAARTQELAAARLALRAEGKGMKEVMQATDALLAEKGWLA